MLLNYSANPLYLLPTQMAFYISRVENPSIHGHFPTIGEAKEVG